MIDLDSAWVDEKMKQFEAGEWETGDGKILQITEMDDWHIASCIKMLAKSEVYWLAELYIDAFQHELNQRYERFYNGIFGGYGNE